MNHLLRPRALKKAVASLLSPLIVLTSLLGAVPARAQVEAASRAAEAGLGGAPAAVRFAPAVLGAAPLAISAAPGLAPSAAASVGALSIPGAAPTPTLAPAAAALPAAAPAALSLLPAASVPAAAPAPAATPAAAAPALTASGAKAAPSASAEAAPRTVLGTLAQTVKTAAASAVASMFDGGKAAPAGTALASGILHRPYGEPVLPKGVRLDARPRATDAGTKRTSKFHLSRGHVLDDGTQPVTLDADPTSPASVEAALRALVGSDPAKYGASSEQMAKVSVNILPSVLPDQAPTILAVFRQWAKGTDKDGSPYYLLVDGAALTFHIKVFGGKPVVMGTDGRLAPAIDPAIMNPAYTDDELLAIAEKRLQSPPDPQPGAPDQGAKADKSEKKPKPSKSSKSKTSKKKKTGSAIRQDDSINSAKKKSSDQDPQVQPPQFLSRVITNQFDGTWRAINLYQAADLQGQPLIVAVDVKDGKAFAFSAQDFRQHAVDPGMISGVVSGRGTTMTSAGDDNGPIGPIALPFTNVYDENGKVVAVTDAQGRFTAPAGSTKLTIRLASPFVPFVTDDDAAKNGPVEITVDATPGEPMTVALNPVSAEPELAASIVGYVGFLQHMIWVKGLPGMNDPRIDSPMTGGIRVNGHDQSGNAYYNPANNSINYMAAAVITVHGANGRPVKLKVENTAKQSIDYHELTHHKVQLFAQVSLTPEQEASPAYRFVKWTMNTIMGDDVNESIADFVSDSMRDNGIIGQGFFQNPQPGKPTFIRNADDKTPYDPKNPDPHNGVTVESMWALRNGGFVSTLGEAAGKAYANAMIPLVIIGQPLNPISALLHIILWDMRADGTSPFADLIRRIAQQDHGIDLPAVPAAPAGAPSA